MRLPQCARTSRRNEPKAITVSYDLTKLSRCTDRSSVANAVREHRFSPVALPPDEDKSFAYFARSRSSAVRRPIVNLLQPYCACNSARRKINRNDARPTTVARLVPEARKRPRRSAEKHFLFYAPIGAPCARENALRRCHAIIRVAVYAVRARVRNDGRDTLISLLFSSPAFNSDRIKSAQPITQYRALAAHL